MSSGDMCSRMGFNYRSLPRKIIVTYRGGNQEDPECVIAAQSLSKKRQSLPPRKVGRIMGEGWRSGEVARKEMGKLSYVSIGRILTSCLSR